MVIQRWQSVLLLTAAAVMGVFSFTDIAQISTNTHTVMFSPLGFTFIGGPATPPEHTLFFFILSLLSALLPLIAIFLYKKLKLQKQMCVYSILVQLAVVFYGLFLGYQGIEGGSIDWLQMSCAPFIAIVATIMAWQRINADKRLLESVDRLR